MPFRIKLVTPAACESVIGIMNDPRDAAMLVRLHRALQEYIDAVHESLNRVERLTDQLLLCARFKRLAARAKTKQVVVIAIARELSAFLWAMAKQVQPVV